MSNSSKFVRSLNFVIFLIQILQFLIVIINLSVTKTRADIFAQQIDPKKNGGFHYTDGFLIVGETITFVVTALYLIIYTFTVLLPRSPTGRFAASHRRLINISRPILRLSFDNFLVIFWTFIAIGWLGSNYGFCRDNGGCPGRSFGGFNYGPGGQLMGANGDLVILNAGLTAIIWGLAILAEIAECCGACEGRKRERRMGGEAEKTVDVEKEEKDERRRGYADVPPPSSHVSTSTGQQRLSAYSEGQGSSVTRMTMTTLPPYEETPGLNAVVDKACR